MPSKKVTWKDENVKIVNESGASASGHKKPIANGKESPVNGEMEKVTQQKVSSGPKEEAKVQNPKKIVNSIDDGDIRTKTTDKVSNGNIMTSKVKKVHELPKRSNSEPEIAVAKPQSPKKKSMEKYHVCILCSPEKKFFIKNLQIQLEKHGYLCKICSSADDYVPITESEIVICCISLRYSKSSIAAREIAKAEKLQKPIIPLLLDNIDYPPSGPLKVSMSKLIHVDCADVKFNSKWEGEEQVEEILDRLEVYIPDVQPKRVSGPRPAKQSNIPRALNSVWKEKILPTEPLAREASEIRIQIRPPTPVRKDISNIPIPNRLNPNKSNLNNNTDDEDEDEEDSVEDEDEYEETDDDTDSYVSTDSETREARKLQKINKLPQLPDAKRHIEQNNNRYQSNVESQNDYQKKQEPPTVGNKKQNIRSGNGNGFKNDPGGPKLPSLYRQKNSNRVY